jgi:hypothetical protein
MLNPLIASDACADAFPVHLRRRSVGATITNLIANKSCTGTLDCRPSGASTYESL